MSEKKPSKPPYFIILTLVIFFVVVFNYPREPRPYQGMDLTKQEIYEAEQRDKRNNDACVALLNAQPWRSSC